MASRRRSKLNIPMFIASLLLCLTLFSFHLTSGLYAKYTTVSSGSDSGRVAAFGNITLTESGDFYETNKLMIIPGVDLVKKAVVDFTPCEMSVYVFVEITAPSWDTSDNRSFSLYSGSKPLMSWSVGADWDYVTGADGTYVYCYKNELAPNTAVSGCDIIANGGAVSVSEYITESDLSTLGDVEISLRAAAVQSGGFDSPSAAWTSISSAS